MTLVHSGASAVIPTGADLNWRTVWPGQWTCDNAGYIWADSLKGGKTHMIDVRGWGYLTGRGMGALDLDNVTASRLQDELGALLCAAPEMLEALRYAENTIVAMRPTFSQVKDEGHAYHDQVLDTVRAAIRKATPPAADTQVGTSNASEPKNLPTNGDSQ